MNTNHDTASSPKTAHNRRPRRTHVAAGAALAASAMLLTACTSEATATGPETATPSASEAHSHDLQASRLAITYDGGVLVLDGDSLEVVSDIPLAGFNRVNPAGDDRHVIVSTSDAFRVLDTGLVTHDDHIHEETPVLTEITFSADRPGHVVTHAGRTVLFSDGSGLVESFASEELANGKPPTEQYTTAQPHHGVAVELEDGGMLVTLGGEDERSGVAVLNDAREEVTRSEECPGVHGEATAKNEAVAVGCENGALIYTNGAITKVSSPDAAGRIGTLVGASDQAVLLGDYKVGDNKTPEQVSLLDTASKQLNIVDLGTSYSFRSLARGPRGEALVLGTDGAIHVIDQTSGTVSESIPVVDAWTEPTEWKDPRPALFVLGGIAYVTDPATQSIHAVDLESGDIQTTAELPHVPNELTGVGV
ncbi:zinc metallochaperone AztD [Lysinibacter cavernae]|uniref:Secreted protein n=1 Tax=Lysinibacter cavernae TaxID=1640652 RepID=A0A7X5R2J6_9MICO|nr:zinc metallochaperone AztD [Lysinibacter cavernae]NIH54510.1 hypothetical protein [Lysinibacter cavernae]